MPETVTPAKLPGEQFEMLRSGLLTAFDRDDLEDLVRVHLSTRLDDVVYARDPLRVVVGNLIEFCVKNGLLDALVAAAHAERPNLGQFLVYRRNYAPDLLAVPAKPPATGPSPGSGIALVATQPAGAPVFRTLATHRPDIAAIADDIEMLERYKSLHDLLHDFEIRLVDIVSTTAGKPEKSDRDHLNLLDYTDQLFDLGDRAEGASQGLPTLADEQRWIADLRGAAEALQRAADPSLYPATAPAAAAAPAVQPEQEVARLRSVLGALPRINSILVERARSLAGSLLKLGDILRQSSSALPDAAVAGSVTGDSTALDATRLELHRLVAEHDLWQLLDVNLREAGVPDAPALDRLLAMWPLLAIEAGELCAPHASEPWAVKLRESIQRFDGAADLMADQATPPDTSAARVAIGRQTWERRAAFRTFRQVARDRFFAVDAELRTFCGGMAARLNEPLIVLLEKIP